MHGNSVGNKDQRSLFSQLEVALRANRALWLIKKKEKVQAGALRKCQQ